jgi:hypothetical protein
VCLLRGTVRTGSLNINQVAVSLKTASTYYTVLVFRQCHWVESKSRQAMYCTYILTLGRVCASIIALEKQWVLHNVCVCVFVALGIQHAMRMRHIVICGLPGCKYFYRLSHKRHDFRKTTTEHKMCVLIFPIHFFWNISLSKKEWARYDFKNVYRSAYTVPLFFSDFNETWIFRTDFRKILKSQISWKSIQWEPSCSLRADGRTWRN